MDFSCGLLPLIQSKKKNSKKHNRRSPITVEISTSDPENNTTIWRAAVLSFDGDAEESLASRRLITEVLRKPIHPIQQELPSSFRSKNVDGYTDLVWCVHSVSRQPLETRFYVTAEYNPRYDVVLGRRDIQEFDNQVGMAS
jgi:hypothetical protein